MNDVALLIDGKSATAQDGGSFDRIDPVKGSVASKAAAARALMCGRQWRRRQTHFRSGPTWAQAGVANCCCKAAETLVAHQTEFIDCMIAETGATERVGRVQCRVCRFYPARSRFDDFADHRRSYSQRCTGQSRLGDSPADGCVCGNRPLECAGHPGRAGDRHASGMRKHGGI